MKSWCNWLQNRVIASSLIAAELLKKTVEELEKQEAITAKALDDEGKAETALDGLYDKLDALESQLVPFEFV